MPTGWPGLRPANCHSRAAVAYFNPELSRRSDALTDRTAPPRSQNRPGRPGLDRRHGAGAGPAWRRPARRVHGLRDRGIRRTLYRRLPRRNARAGSGRGPVACRRAAPRRRGRRRRGPHDRRAGEAARGGLHRARSSRGPLDQARHDDPDRRGGPAAGRRRRAVRDRVTAGRIGDRLLHLRGGPVRQADRDPAGGFPAQPGHRHPAQCRRPDLPRLGPADRNRHPQCRPHARAPDGPLDVPDRARRADSRSERPGADVVIVIRDFLTLRCAPIS